METQVGRIYIRNEVEFSKRILPWAVSKSLRIPEN